MSLEDRYLDAVFGSTELFLYNVDRIITKIDVAQGTFTWVARNSLMETVGSNLSDDMFLDAALLGGNSYLPTFAPVAIASRRHPNGSPIKEAANMISSMGRSGSGISVIMLSQDKDNVQRLEYADRFKRTKTAIKHSIVFTDKGNAVALDSANVPQDLYKITGQRLPDELYFYLQMGVCGPRVLNWLTNGVLTESAPLDNGDSPEYRAFIRTGLAGIRTEALSLLAQRLHHYYQSKKIDAKFWWDMQSADAVVHKDLEPSPADQVASWMIRDAWIAEAKGVVKVCPYIF
jgi:hypothetical protein